MDVARPHEHRPAQDLVQDLGDGFVAGEGELADRPQGEGEPIGVGVAEAVPDGESLLDLVGVELDRAHRPLEHAGDLVDEREVAGIGHADDDRLASGSIDDAEHDDVVLRCIGIGKEPHGAGVDRELRQLVKGLERRLAIIQGRCSR
ncbi:MAG: hypothetical protein U0166_22615 [Acidobacteriota bacterium]